MTTFTWFCVPCGRCSQVETKDDIDLLSLVKLIRGEHDRLNDSPQGRCEADPYYTTHGVRCGHWLKDLKK